MTAIEWLEEQLEKYQFVQYWSPDKCIVIKIKITPNQYNNLLEQAKEMEKQQIIDAFGVGCHHESKRLVGYQDIAEQYYNETYGNKGSDGIENN